ncbi:hypothetical protein KC340_g6030 [Hortaea werneckii]|nr:hypothetical protein KC342_g11603 [Hortaea werneckii]KAI7094126.1 hypothetical protein KC339_g11782 [Hortaea werneckii]KAI7325686.1 hypothetical protein KC340_g6030 [Hortaea werneckii]KAI7366739.1 hypothetical protein KC354_g3938 [Hortaea werneckii]KAI7388191.1 hypothetical protein KC328_g9068 [Hortaea werneckii]
MFGDTSFSHASASILPPQIQIEHAIATLHDFETVIKLSPDCRGCRPIPPPEQKNGFKKQPNGTPNGDACRYQYYEVEDDLPFIPKKFWSGGVKYVADFLPTDDGCDITVHAPGFTSTNHWRILHEAIPEDSEAQLTRVKSKDLSHADTTSRGGQWYIEIASEAKCNRTFAGFVKGFLKNTHTHLQNAFIERVKEPAKRPGGPPRRPTLGRRRSSEF